MRTLVALLLPLLLAACGGAEENKVTETRMDDIDSLQGTISDEMPNPDELNEQPLVEAAPPPGAAPKAKAKEERPEKAVDSAPPAKAVVEPAAE